MPCLSNCSTAHFPRGRAPSTSLGLLLLYAQRVNYDTLRESEGPMAIFHMGYHELKPHLPSLQLLQVLRLNVASGRRSVRLWVLECWGHCWGAVPMEGSVPTCCLSPPRLTQHCSPL